MNLLVDMILTPADASIGQSPLRILALNAEVDQAIVISLNLRKRSEKPRICSLGKLTSDLQSGSYTIADSEVSPWTVAPDDIDEEDVEKRDKAFQAVAPLVENPNFLSRYARGHVRGIAAAAETAGVSRQCVYYRLTRFFRSGQKKSGLLPRYGDCGGAGKPKKLGAKKIGRPVVQPLGSATIDPGINVSDTDKKNIVTIIMEYYATTDQPTLEASYEELADQFYEDEVFSAEETGCEISVISRRQFVTWARKLCDWDEVEKRRLCESEYEGTRRPLNSKVVAHVSGPGDRYETDSTPIPVHCVAADNRNDVIGKPHAYLCVDEKTWLITGSHLCLESPSWDQSAQLMANTCCDKVSYCARYGIDISSDDWPSHHIPRAILCDRGENISQQAELAFDNLGIRVEFPPPYRGDRKPLVERLWLLAANEFWHRVLGTTKSKRRRPGERDPRLDACLNLWEITRLTILKILQFNAHRRIADILTSEMIAKDIAPTPLNAWRLHLTNQAHSLGFADELQVRGQLMRRVKASVTERGIQFDGTHYTCDLAENQRWYETARREGHWTIDAHVDESWTNELFIRVPSSKLVVPCQIRAFEELRSGKSFADVRYIDDFVNRKERGPDVLASKIRFNREMKATVAAARQEKADNVVPMSNATRVKNVRKNRQREISRSKGAGTTQPTREPPPEHRAEIIDILRADVDEDEQG